MGRWGWRAVLVAAVAVAAPARAQDPPAAAFEELAARFQRLQAERDEAARARLLEELGARCRAFLDAHRAAASGEQLTLAAGVWLQVAARKDDWAGVEREVAALRALPALPPQLQRFLAELEPTIPGRPAPAWTARDVETGEEVALERLRGKLVLVHLWASWCPPCRSLLEQHLQPLHEGYAARGAEFQLIGLGQPGHGETPGKQAEFSRQRGYAWRHLFDAGGEAGRGHRAEVLPYLVLIDPQGRLLVAGPGWGVIEKVKQVLAERLGPPAGAPAPAEPPRKE